MVYYWTSETHWERLWQKWVKSKMVKHLFEFIGHSLTECANSFCCSSPSKRNQAQSKIGPTSLQYIKTGDLIQQSLPPKLSLELFLHFFPNTKANQWNQWIHQSSKQTTKQLSCRCCARPEKRLSVQLVRWAAQATALEARSGGRPLWLGWSWRTNHLFPQKTLQDWGSTFQSFG